MVLYSPDISSKSVFAFMSHSATKVNMVGVTCKH